MNKRAICFLAAALSWIFVIAGCVSVEMPEHMVSDTVHAGKDVYRSVKHGEGDTSMDANGLTFDYTRVGHEDETLKMVKEGCLDKAEQKARKELALKKGDELEFRVISEEGEVSEDHIIVRCAIMVPDDKDDSQKANEQDQVPPASQ